MLIFNYSSKKKMQGSIGKALNYAETSFFGPEYLADGILIGSNRPSITGIRNDKGGKAREFFAQVTMKNGKIHSVK